MSEVPCADAGDEDGALADVMGASLVGACAGCGVSCVEECLPSLALGLVLLPIPASDCGLRHATHLYLLACVGTLVQHGETDGWRSGGCGAGGCGVRIGSIACAYRSVALCSVDRVG